MEFKTILYQKEGKNFAIVHSLDGYDEISLTSPFKVFTQLKENLYEPEKLGFRTLSQSELFGGDTVAEAADIFMKIIQGEGTEAQNQVIMINAGMAIHCAKSYTTLNDCIELAKEILLSKKAYQTFKKFLED